MTFELKDIDAFWGAFWDDLNDEKFCDQLRVDMRDFKIFNEKYGSLFLDDNDIHNAIWQAQDLEFPCT